MATDKTYDFSIDQGATWNRSIVWQQNGVAVNITGFTSRMWLKRSITDTTALFMLTTENGGIVIDGPNGKVTLSMTNEQTDTLNGTYVYDLKLASPSGDEFRLIQGKVLVSPQVTA